MGVTERMARCKRGSTARAAIALAAVIFAGACGGPSGSGEGASGGSGSERASADATLEAPPSEQDDAGIVEPTSLPDEAVVIAVRSIPRSLDPLTDLDPWAARIVEDALFQGLTRRVATGAPWAEPARDAYCPVPKDRVFHDGSAVAIDDVVYSLEHWLDPRRSGLRMRHGLSALRRVEVVDAPPRGSGADASDPGRWIRLSSEDV